MAKVGDLLDLIAPSVLRDRFDLSYGAWREEFQPRFLTTDSYEEMIGELGRFVAHVMSRWFGHGVSWPIDRGRGTAVELLNNQLGDGAHPKAGEFEAMRVCRHGENGGMRYLLDVLGRALMQQALTQYLDCVVMPRINRLGPAESLALAERYLELYRVVPGMKLESPAGIALRWRQVIRQHANAVLRG